MLLVLRHAPRLLLPPSYTERKTTRAAWSCTFFVRDVTIFTVLRRRSLGSPAAGKTRYGGFWEKYSRTQHLLWFGDSIHVSDPPLP
jgi:hypothetical protein